MKFLKWLGLTIIGLLLFLSLGVFGIAFSIKTTVLNSNFISSEINKFPLSTYTNQLVLQDNTAGTDTEIKAALVKTISDQEPQIKNDLGGALPQIYDYLLGKKQSPELSSSLRQVLNNEFGDKFVDNFALANYASNRVLQQINQSDIPSEFQPALQFIEPAFTQAEPQLKAGLKKGMPSLLDYLCGLRGDFTITLDIKPAVDNFIALAKAYYLKNPPPSLSGVPQIMLVAGIDTFIDQHYQQYINPSAPVLYTIDRNMANLNINTSQQINDTEVWLRDVRAVVERFQLYFILLIAFIFVLIAAVIAIYHSIKPAASTLGSIFISYGLIEFVMVLLLKQYLLPGPILSQLKSSGASTEISTFVVNLANHALSPLMWFSLGVLIVGIVLLVVSIVYRTGNEPVKI
jgi:hypothetical protein